MAWWVWLIILLVCAMFFCGLYIVYDKRKSIFKKRQKSAPKRQKKHKNQDVAPVTTNDNDEVSFTENAVKNIPNVKIHCENYVADEDEQHDFPEPSFARRREFPRMRERDFYSQHRASKKKPSIRQQIDELSPEMKGILFSNALGKKDD